MIFKTLVKSGIAVAIILLSGLFSPLWADVITLKNDRKIRGRVLKMTRDKVLVEVPGGKIWFPLDKVVKIVEENPRTYYWGQAQYLFKIGAYDQAYLYFSRLLPRRLDQVLPALYKCRLLEGKKHYERRHYAVARPYFLKAHFLFPSRLEPLWYLAAIEGLKVRRKKLLAQGQRKLDEKKYQAAWKDFSSARDLLPVQGDRVFSHLAQVRLAQAIDLYKQKSYAKASRYFHQAISFDLNLLGNYGQAYINCSMYRIRDLIEEGKYKKALDYLVELKHLAPLSRKITYFTGLAHHGQREYVKAADNYYEVLGRSRPKKKGKINIVALRKEAENRALSPLPGQAKRKAKKLKSEDSWQKSTIAYFHIHHRNRDVAQKAKKLINFFYSRIKKALLPRSYGKEFIPPVQIWIHPSRKAFEEAVPHFHLDGYSKVKEHFGKVVELEFHTYQGAPLFDYRTFSHHLAHLLFGYIYPYAHVAPLWVREGFALAMESTLVHSHFERRMWHYLKCDLPLPIESFLQRRKFPQENPRRFRALSFSALSFLARRYTKARLLKFFEISSEEKPLPAIPRALPCHNVFHFKNEWWSENKRHLYPLYNGEKKEKKPPGKSSPKKSPGWEKKIK